MRGAAMPKATSNDLPSPPSSEAATPILMTPPEPGAQMPIDPLFADIPEDGGDPQFRQHIAQLVRELDRPAAQVWHVPAVIADAAAAAAVVARIATHCQRGKRGDIRDLNELRAAIGVAVIASRAIVRTLPALTPRAQIQAAVANLAAGLVTEDALQRRMATGNTQDFRRHESQAQEAREQWAHIGLQIETVLPQAARNLYGMTPDLVALDAETRRHHYPELKRIFTAIDAWTRDAGEPLCEVRTREQAK
jgi:hypothetical protein